MQKRNDSFQHVIQTKNLNKNENNQYKKNQFLTQSILSRELQSLGYSGALEESQYVDEEWNLAMQDGEEKMSDENYNPIRIKKYVMIFYSNQELIDEDGECAILPQYMTFNALPQSLLQE